MVTFQNPKANSDYESDSQDSKKTEAEVESSSQESEKYTSIQMKVQFLDIQ